MKEVHLVCNAHIDPIWQWEWDEGAATAISTFQSAVNLADEFDYIFCHNEVTLYKYIEEYAPALFEKIKRLIAAGKWHVMGGWYLQPDCNMPCGESLVRQIQVGHKYFREKLVVNPTTAINFDPFGHSRGLVQIIKKCGQDSYLICRPSIGDTDPPLKDRQFLWRGFDGSTIKVNLCNFYVSQLGEAAGKIARESKNEPQDVLCVLWGVGNHGGGPSRKDLGDIEELMKNGEIKMMHSTPENFFARINPEYVYYFSLWTSMPGCYTTMSRIKNKHMQLENELYLTEKMCSAASIKGLIDYPQNEFDEAVEDLLNAEFHDVLPGSSIQAAEENGLRYFDHALHILQKLKVKTFFALSAAQEPAKPGEFPILVFNPNPYEYKTNIECELMIERNDTLEQWTELTVFDGTGNELPLQSVKTEGNVNLDWRKRVVFEGSLKPFETARFSIYTKMVPFAQPPERDCVIDEIENKYIEIDKNTGLLKSFRLHGKEYISNGFLPVMFDDNEDPWAMASREHKEGMGTNRQPFEPMRKPHGIFKGLKQVETIEDGEIYLGVESFFEKDDSKVRVEYKIYKNNPYIDVNVTVFWNEANKMLKLEIPVCPEGQYIGQGAFGTENLYMDGRECVSQRFSAVKMNDGKCLAVIKNCCYGSSFKEGTISLSMIRGACYCAHPIGSRPIIPTDRFIKRIDQGERTFGFRIAVCEEQELERLAQEYSQKVYALNVFPIENNTISADFKIIIDNKDIVLAAMKKSETREGYVLRLVNNSETAAVAALELNKCKIALTFGKYEVKTVLFKGEILTELQEMII